MRRSPSGGSELLDPKQLHSLFTPGDDIMGSLEMEEGSPTSP